MPKTKFQRSLIDWYQRHKRDLPWRSTADPYRIWLSEVILQQTRVEQGLPYYEKFVRNYPTVLDLANADEDRVLKDWEGLGYYSRARNLHQASKQVAQERKGVFPDEHLEILKLKGVGEYTAAAISSFAYSLPHAVVDGNVFRVLARYLNIDIPINTTKGKKEFAARAEEMLDAKDPATYNQAIMEFGALQCVPKNPDCGICPLKESCAAFRLDRVNQLPIKQKKNYDRKRFFNYALISCQDEVLVEQRTERDIWNKLYQFPLLEGAVLAEPEELIMELFPSAEGEITVMEVATLPKHKLSHQSIFIRITEVEMDQKYSVRKGGSGNWVPKDKLASYAFPKPLRAYLDRKQLTLSL